MSKDIAVSGDRDRSGAGHAAARVALRLMLDPLARSDSHAFDQFYAIYAAQFPLEDEREPPEAFHAILDLNENLAVQRRYGPYREVVAAVRQWDSGPVVGGHVFGVTTSAAHHAAGYPASIQAIYTFLVPAVRGQLSMAAFTRYSETIARTTFAFGRNPPPKRPLMIFEVNNPLRMTAQEIADDAASSGLHPARRYMFWQRCGFAPLDFPYVQPRLRADAEPVRYLDLFCSAIPERSMPGAVLLAHLRAFISVSVLKGDDAAGDPEFRLMAQWLADRSDVRFVQDNDPRSAKIIELSRAVRGTKERRGSDSG